MSTQTAALAESWSGKEQESKWGSCMLRPHSRTDTSWGDGKRGAFLLSSRVRLFHFSQINNHPGEAESQKGVGKVWIFCLISHIVCVCVSLGIVLVFQVFETRSKIWKSKCYCSLFCGLKRKRGGERQSWISFYLQVLKNKSATSHKQTNKKNSYILL